MANGYLIRNGTGMTNVSFVANPTVGSRIWISSKQYTTIAYGNTYNAAYRYGNGIGDIRYQNYSIAAPGSKTFTSSGTFTVPNGVTQIRVFCVGGGGAGGFSAYSMRSGRHGDSWMDTNEGETQGGGGGGGGGYVTNTTMNVTPGQQISVTIGAGGTYSQYTMWYYNSNPSEAAGTVARWRRGSSGGKGGTTYCGSVSAAGGNGGGAGSGPDQPTGATKWSTTGGSGGTGYGNGGKGGNSGQSDDYDTAKANRDGGNGGDGYNYNGTIYSGGGAGDAGGFQTYGWETSIFWGSVGSPGGRGSKVGEYPIANTGGGSGAANNSLDRYTVSDTGDSESSAGSTTVYQITGNAGSGICIISWG